MKLIYAGQGVSASPYTNLLFNCTRNARCQNPFYVPVEAFSDISLYADLTGSPTLVEISVIDVCGPVENTGTAVSTQYVVGTKPDETWYGVFSGLVVTPPVGVTYTRFFFKLSFTIAGIVHVYYSQQYEFPVCEDLTFVQGCYPNEEAGTSAFDCNGIYYGFPNSEDFLGSEYFRYVHSGYVRLGSIIEQKNTMTFTAFNNKRIYKSVFNREWLFEFEIVPTFYKDHLVGIFNRGNVRVQLPGEALFEWKLAESQDISILSTDSKLWRMDMLFDAECKQVFGCKPADCVLPGPPDPCCDPTVTGASVETVNCCSPVVSSATAQLGCERLEIQGGASGATLEWDDCETGTFLSQFVATGEQVSRCGRTGSFNVVGDHTIIFSGEC